MLGDVQIADKDLIWLLVSCGSLLQLVLEGLANTIGRKVQQFFFSELDIKSKF